MTADIQQVLERATRLAEEANINIIRAGGYTNLADAYEAIKAQRELMRELAEVLQKWFTCHSNHFEEFGDEVNKQMLCLANDTDAALAKAREAGVL